MSGMTIEKVTIDHFTSEALADIEKLFSEGFEKELVKRKFSWRNFTRYWEAALLFPWNALWFLFDEEEHVVGIIGGSVFPNMLTADAIAVETCWRTAASIKGQGQGWELLATFMEWAASCGASRIMTHRFLSKDSTADDRFDNKIRKMGFSPSGCEYYLDLK
jgi:GNAT superfamily N-acetyltransferase